jgi:hypothetical protein
LQPWNKDIVGSFLTGFRIVTKVKDSRIIADVKPIKYPVVMPVAPVPNRTRTIARRILIIELVTIILGNDLVLSEAIRIERNKLTITDIPIRRISIIVRSIPKLGVNHCLKTNISTLQTIMLEHKISKEPLTRTFVSSAFSSEKLFARKRVLPVGTAKSIICEKIILREITVEAIPITLGVVRLDKKSHKTYPATIPTVLSTNRYVAFFPTVSLSNPFHHPSLILSFMPAI